MNKTMTCTANNRPHYLEQMLTSLSKNKTEGYHLYIQVEPGNPKTIEVCNNIDFMPTTIIKNRKKLGVRENPYKLLEKVFEIDGSDFNIYLEDDIIISPDVTSLANWFLNLQDLQDYLCLNLFNYYSNAWKNNPSYILEIQHIKDYNPFTALGILLTKESWSNYFKPNWHKDKRGWDYSFASLLKNQTSLKALYCGLSRANHIGRVGGTHCQPNFHDKTFSQLVINESVDIRYELGQSPKNDGTWNVDKS